MPDEPIRPDRLDFTYGGAAHLIEQEIRHLRAWRQLECDEEAPEKDVLRAGLALSGGGIRSASFSLGVLQALAHVSWLPKFDYLSTVSGGGYIGSSLTYLLHRKWEPVPGSKGASAKPVVFGVTRDSFPYQSFPMVDVAPKSAETEAAHTKGRLLRILRQNAKYLTPGGGITALSLLGVVLRNSTVSLIVHFGVAVLLFEVLRLSGLIPGGHDQSAANRALCGALIALGIYALLSFAYAAATRAFDWLTAGSPTLSYRLRRAYEIACTVLFGLILLLLLIGGTPWIHQWLSGLADKHPGFADLSKFGGLASALLGLLTTLAAHFQSAGAKASRVPLGARVAVGSALLLFGLLLFAYQTSLLPVDGRPGTGQPSAVSDTAVIVACVGAVFFLGWLPHVNYLSLHRYYRDRLMETFMPDVEKVISRADDLRPRMTSTGNNTMLGTVCGVNPDGLERAARRDPKAAENGPYHIINANAVLVGSKTPRYRARGGDNFILSPIYSGSTATGWARTDPRPERGMTLATAMAISGAAISPDAACGGEGLTRQAGLSTLMSILNIRLGYWLRNPGKAGRGAEDADSSFVPLVRDKPNLIWPGLAEIFGRPFYLNEDRDYLLVTDGGHFENLALYEMIRRRLKVIVVCDGGADPGYAFSDLANAIEKVRADFGAIIDISDSHLQPLVPRPRPDAPPDPDSSAQKMTQRVAKRGYVFATIRYAKTDRADANTHGLLIYLKTTFFEGLSADLYGYRNAHPRFPDEPTSDQFFDEKQFEAYRELGYNTARSMMIAATADARPWEALVHREAVKAFDEVRFPEVRVSP